MMRQRGSEAPADALEPQREAHERGREGPSAPDEQGDGSPMHWLTLVFSDPNEEKLFRRKTLITSKPFHMTMGGIGMGCFVAMWVAAAWRGPQLIHALWTPWSIGCLAVLLTYGGADGDKMYIYIYTSSNFFVILPVCAYLVNFALVLLLGMEPLADLEFWFWCGAGLVQLLLPFLLAYAPQSKMKVYLVNFVGYSVLALGGCLGDRLRAICIGGLLLGVSITLGIAHERGKRLTFLQASREAAMVGVHIPKEPSDVRRRPERGASACSSSHKRVARALPLIVAQALLMALLMVNSDMPYFARAVLVLIVAGLGYAVQWILVTVGDFGEVLAQVEFLEKA